MGLRVVVDAKIRKVLDVFAYSRNSNFPVATGMAFAAQYRGEGQGVSGVLR